MELPAASYEKQTAKGLELGLAGPFRHFALKSGGYSALWLLNRDWPEVRVTLRACWRQVALRGALVVLRLA